MAALIVFFLRLVTSHFESRSRLEAENAALRQQLKVLQREVRGRVRVNNSDDAARNLLAPVYDWFAEGFDTLDLKEAKASLDALVS